MVIKEQMDGGRKDCNVHGVGFKSTFLLYL